MSEPKVFNVRTNISEFNPDVLELEFFKEFPRFNEEEKAEFSKAWKFLIEKTGDIKRSCGKPYFLHPMRVAALLADTNMDMDCIVCGLLHSILEIHDEEMNQKVTAEEIEEKFGKTITRIVSDTS